MLSRHSLIIYSNVDELVANTNLETFVPEIVKSNVLSQEMISDILSKAGPDLREQSRAIFLRVPKRGPLAFTGLVTALLKSGHENLAHRLINADGIDGHQRDSPDCHYGNRSQPFQLPQYLDNKLKDVLPEPAPDRFIDLNSLTTSINTVQLRYSDDIIVSGELSPVECYPMMSKPRGFALIINNIEFQGIYHKRRGAENDTVVLIDFFQKLYFEVETHTNKTKPEMVDIIEKFAAKDAWSMVDCCWVVLMSHGQEGRSEEDTEILGTDGIGLRTLDVLSYFHNNNCPKLRTKPKIFIFQACRGKLTDQGVKLHLHGGPTPYNYHLRTEHDGRPMDKSVVFDRSQSDMFVAYPVPPGIKANRDILTGAWFIQTIVSVFSEYCHQLDLEDLFKMVDQQVRKLMNVEFINHQSVSTKTIGWNKKLYFNPGLYYKDGQLMRENNVNGKDVVDHQILDESLHIIDSDEEKETKLCFPCHP